MKNSVKPDPSWKPDETEPSVTNIRINEIEHDIQILDSPSAVPGPSYVVEQNESAVQKIAAAELAWKQGCVRKFLEYLW